MVRFVDGDGVDEVLLLLLLGGRGPFVGASSNHVVRFSTIITKVIFLASSSFCIGGWDA
jgi:hypothetical protein